MAKFAHDDQRMPFRPYRGKLLREVPDDYWLWFRRQPWAVQYEDLLRYADAVDPAITTRDYKTGEVKDG